MSYITVPLHPTHKKKDFRCGAEMLDNYLHTQAKQDIKRKLAACFILCDTDNNVQGYYTLSSSSIPREQLPDNVIAKLPPAYYNLPVTLLGRLAVGNVYKGQGLGAALLFDALKRSYTAIAEIGSMAVVVEPIDEAAIRFYEKHGFALLPTSGKMVLSMDTISSLV
jgi:predicted GNAT family N-acyltransferase